MSGDPADDIMAATYRALCRHGYADLTMQDIADETDRSKAALHYHYDGKADLFAAFLEHLADEFEAHVTAHEGPDAADRLVDLATSLLDPPPQDDDCRFQTAMLEVKAQAPYDETFRERLVAVDDRLRREVRSLVEAGVDEGTFRADADPERAARFVATVVNGAHTREVAVGRDAADVEALIERYVDRELGAAAGDRR
jgi:AcrR family transcriptional regulator